MSFRAELTIDDKTYRVLSCSHSVRRDTDQTGRPSSRPRLGKIDLEVESTDDIFLWIESCMPNPEGLSGKIVFKKRDEEVKMKEVEFSGAHVVEHTERFLSIGDSPMVIAFTLSAQSIAVTSSSNSASLSNEWAMGAT